MFIYSIKNEKISYFNKPIFAVSDEEALNILRSTIASDYTGGLLALCSELSFYCNGTVDFTTGHYSSFKKPRFICSVDKFMEDVVDTILRSNFEYQNSLENSSEVSDA